jgi:predicted dithiol-disulfide oxidoreductase (DUF899 family)
MTDHKIVSREEWQAARDELLKREKQHTPGSPGAGHCGGA